jgi:DNA-binding transcriptional LysR family regulator
MFDTVYTERNLTRAARVLNVTQPAVRNALKRLRQVFKDELFVRTPHGVTPTPAADNISRPIKEALHLLNMSLMEGDRFLPGSSEKSFVLSVHDYDEALVIPRLMEQLAVRAPQVSVECYSVPRKDLESELAAGSLDFALDVPLFSAPQLCRKRLTTERYVCMVRPGHPSVEEKLTLEQYLGLEHIHISGRRQGVGHVDRALERLGLQRKIKVRMQTYMAGPQLVASTDLALTIPRNLASMYDMKTLEMPFNVEALDQYLYWHKSTDQDRANQWFRSILTDLLFPVTS